MTMLERIGKQAFGDEAGGVGYISHYQRFNLICYGADAGIVPIAAIGRSATDDQFGFVLERLLLHVVIIYEAIFFLYAIEDGIVELAGEIDRGAVGEVATHAQIEAENGVSRLKAGKHDSRIRLSAAMGLDVSVFYPKYFFSPVDCELLTLVHNLTATIIPLAGVSFCVFIGHYIPHGLHDLLASKVFGCDEL